MQDEEDEAAIHFQSDLRSVHSNVQVLPEDEVQPCDSSGSACGDGVQVLHQTLQMGHFLGEFVRLIRLRERESHARRAVLELGLRDARQRRERTTN